MGIEGKTILVFLADKNLSKITQRIIEGAGMLGFEIHSSDSLELLTHAVTPHLILVDLDLSKAEGLKLLEIKKNKSNLSNIPILAVGSSKDEKAVMRRSKAIAAVDYILKPINSTVLLQKIRKIFQHHKNHPKASVVLKSDSFAEIMVNGSITKMNDEGLVFEGPVRILASEYVELFSPLVDELNVLSRVFKPVIDAETTAEEGRYSTKLKFLASSEEMRNTILRYMKVSK